MSKRIITELCFEGKSPQAAIRYLTDLINRQKEADKRFLRIESYQETYCHPFIDGTKELRLVVDRPQTKDN